MYFLKRIIVLLLCSHICISRSIFRGTEIGDKVKFSWTLKSKSLKLSVKLPDTYKWIALGFHDVPFSGNYWEDLAMITIDMEKGSEVSFLKTLHLDVQNTIYESDVDVYEWAKRGRQKSKKNYYFTIKRDADILPTSTPVTFMWAYGTEYTGAFPKVSEFKKVLITLDDPTSLKTALENMQSAVLTTSSSPLALDGVKDKVKTSGDKDVSPTNADKVAVAEETVGEKTVSEKAASEKTTTLAAPPLPNNPVKPSDTVPPVNPVEVTSYEKMTTASAATTTTAPAVVKHKTLPQPEKTLPPPLEPVVPKEPAMSSNENAPDEPANIPSISSPKEVVDATENPEKASLDSSKKEEASVPIDQTAVKKKEDKELTDEYKPEDQHGRAKPKSSSVDVCGIDLCSYSRCSKDKECRVDLETCTSSCIGKISMAVPACNCTKTESWYSYFRNNENAVYFGVIGFSAFFTGLIVLCLACCCARKAKRLPRTRKNKVSFYKVDDFDSSADEEIEFLKSNGEDAEDEVYTKN